MHQQEGYWVIRTYEAGGIGEKTKYFVTGTRPTRKTRKMYRETQRAEKKNEASAIKAMARLIHANFAAGDLLLGLDYNPEGLEKIQTWGRKNGLLIDSGDEMDARDAEWEAAAHELDQAIRRVKRRLGKEDKELKAIYITSDMDGETGERVRVHHHLIVSADSLDAFKSAWAEAGLGSVNYTPLSEHQIDRTPMAEYLLKQVRRIKDAKKYRSTRNLIRPQPKDRIAISDSEIRVPKHTSLLFRQAYKPGWPQYIRYLIIPEEKRNPPAKRPGDQG